MLLSLLTTEVRSEHNVILTRQRARQIAELLGFDSSDQTRIATAVSEIARNAIQHAAGGKVEFRFDDANPQALQVEISDQGPGIVDLDTMLAGHGVGVTLRGVRRLMDLCGIDTSPARGTRITLRKDLPRLAPPIQRRKIATITDQLMKRGADDPLAEMQRQNQELLHTLEELRVQQEATHLREQWLSTTLRSIGDAVIATDIHERILFMNPVAEQMTGWTQAEATGKEASEVCQIISEQTRRKVADLLDHVLGNAIVKGLTDGFLLVARDGVERFIDDSGAPILNEEGHRTGAVLVFRDITARILAQREQARLLVEHVTEIETLNRRLKRSMQETHHRVKNNLQIISALVDLQMDEGQSTVPIAAMARIGQHARSLAAIHDLLTQEAKAAVEVNTISAQAAMDKLIPLVQATIGARRINYRGDDFLLPVRDGASLALLVSETISNAVKHGQGDIEVRLIVSGKTALLEICDDGPGFPPGFDWRRSASTGLGLIDSTGRHDLRGTISFENRAEGGARVAITFPLPNHEAAD